MRLHVLTVILNSNAWEVIKNLFWKVHLSPLCQSYEKIKQFQDYCTQLISHNDARREENERRNAHQLYSKLWVKEERVLKSSQIIQIKITDVSRIKAIINVQIILIFIEYPDRLEYIRTVPLFPSPFPI